MNTVVLTGRLTEDPKVTKSENTDGTESVTARYRLAVDRRMKTENGPNADFISCVTFGKAASFTEKYFRKGMKVLVKGRIQTGSYQKDGQTVYTTDVVIEEQEFGEKRPDHQNSSDTSSDGFMNIPDEVADELDFG